MTAIDLNITNGRKWLTIVRGLLPGAHAVVVSIASFTNSAKAAFSHAPIPKDVMIAGDHIGDIWEEIENRFVGLPWFNVSIDAWINTASVHTLMKHFFTPIAFHYYVPSLLIASLENPNYLDWGLDGVLPNNKNHVPRSEWWKEYRSCFTGEQENVIREFLEIASDIATPNSSDAGLCEVAIKLWENP